jgi:acetyl-CoA carboxylase carboxyltransferase component
LKDVWVATVDALACDVWKVKQEQALLGGQRDKIAQQLKAGKKMPRARLDLLLDAGSFEELDQLATSPYLEKKEATDGVVTGFGTISGRRVAVYAQDFTIKGGSLGKRHAEKICKIMDLAAKVGCPIIGIIDSGGARIDEGIHALAGYGAIFSRNCRYSGVVPQLSLVLGPCAGGATYSPALTDFIFTTQGISNLFITGPQVIQQVLHQTITKEDLGGALVHAQRSGVAHVVTQTEDECFTKVKQLLAYLPSNYLAAPPVVAAVASAVTDAGVAAAMVLGNDDPSAIVPQNFNQGYDIKKVIAAVADRDSFYEIHELFAPNIVTGFAFMGGMAVGIVANQPFVKAGAIDIDASCKAARFIRFCDCFGLPIVSLVDVPGYLPGVDQEHNGIIRHGAKLLYAYAAATVPKVTVILRKAFGGAYIVMGSKELGADVNLAWPNAQIAVLGAKAAVSILHGKTLAKESDTDRAAHAATLEAAYAQEFLNPFVAAQAGYIDAIIEPSQTREHLVKALRFTAEKVERLPARKHGNMPL